MRYLTQLRISLHRPDTTDPPAAAATMMLDCTLLQLLLPFLPRQHMPCAVHYSAIKVFAWCGAMDMWPVPAGSCGLRCADSSTTLSIRLLNYCLRVCSLCGKGCKRLKTTPTDSTSLAIGVSREIFPGWWWWWCVCVCVGGERWKEDKVIRQINPNRHCKLPM